MRAKGLTTEIFGGDLRHVSLGSLLQLARAEAVHGWLRVEPDGEVGLENGGVVSARRGRLTGVDALRELLFHDAGRFVLVRGRPTGAVLIEDVMPVVMDAYRLRDEWARISTAVLRRAQGRPWQPSGGPLDLVMPLLDGQRSLASIVAHPNAIVTPLVDAVIAALNSGLLERVRTVHAQEPEQRSQARPPPSPLRTASSLARAPPSAPRVTVPPLPVVAPPRVSEPPRPPEPVAAPRAPIARTSANSVTPVAATTEAADGTDFFELVDRARELMRKDELDAAEASLRRALELRPLDRVVLQNLRALAQRRGAGDRPKR